MAGLLAAAASSIAQELPAQLQPLPSVVNEDTLGVLYERWDDVPGVTVGSLLRSEKFRGAPDATGLIASVEIPEGGGNSYGVRIRGYVVAPASGKVRFFVSSDDNSELWLSPGRDSTAIKRVAWIAGEGRYGWSRPYETARVASQASVPVDVVAGQWYYFEAFHKQNVGKDHFELQWKYEADKKAAPIPTEALRPWNGSEVDGNGDGLADAMQAQTGLAALSGEESRESDAWGDPDGDGVMNIDELAAGTDPLDAGAADGFLLWETWHAMDGNDVVDLVRNPRFNGPADRAVFLRGSSTPVATTGNLGTRLSGFVVPKESGDYQFAVSSDNAAELWFSTSGSWLDKERIAFNDRWRERDSWHILPSQKSRLFHLEAGQAYYVEVIHKDVRAPGWVTLGWKKSSDETFSEIMPEFLRTPGVQAEDADRDFLPDGFTAANEARLKLEEDDAPIRFTQNGDPDSDGLPNLMEAQAGTDPMARSVIQGALTREWWFNVPGQSVVRARNEGVFLKRPSMISLTEGSGSGEDTTDWFASRLRGTLVAPVSGDYRFWIAGDDHCELWLSGNGSKFYKKKIAAVAPAFWENPDAGAWTKPGDWDAKSGQRSEIVRLEAGRTYFIEMLHKAGSGNDHVSVAWQYSEEGSREWSERSEIGAAAVTSFGGDEDDRDDDYLPDSWEIQYGLDPKDNGLKDRAKQGEAGDCDGDGLTNREEFLLGTNPCSADTDGDGVGDYEEIKVYGSNPAAKDASPPVKLMDLPLYGHVAESGHWVESLDGTLRSVGGKGSVGFDFQVGEPGIYLVELDASAFSGSDYCPPVPVVASVDGEEIGRGEVEGGGTALRWMTGFLEAGSHHVLIDNRNVRPGLTLEIRAVSIYRHAGDDLDENSIPDWMQHLFNRLNGVLDHTLGSPVSPLCLEGTSRFSRTTVIETAAGTIRAEPALSGRWFANVPLLEEGNTGITVVYENGAIRSEQELSWTATNLFEATDILRVRPGDSLKLVAIPAGSDGTGTVATYSLDGAALGENPAAKGRVVTFAETGTFDLSVSTVSETEQLSATVQVEVLDADFGPAFSLAAGVPRTWKMPGVPESLALESDPGLALEEISSQPGRSRRVRASYPEGKSGSPRVLARLWEGGPVVATTAVNAFRIVGASESLGASLLATLPDGTQLIEFILMIDGPVPADLSIWLDFYVADAVFENGDTRYHLTAKDFDENGIARLTVYKAPGEGSAAICHWIRPYDGEDDEEAASASEPAAGE